MTDEYTTSPWRRRRDPTSAAERLPARARYLSVLTTLVAAACGLAAGEVAGRLAFGFTPMPGWACELAVVAGIELHPFESYRYTSALGEFDIEVRHNSRGLRDVEHSLAKPPDVSRILILCDSFAHAQEVALGDSFPRLLEERLHEDPEAAPAHVEVVNGGHWGLGTTQEYLFYTLEGRRYHPDLVLLGIYLGNDLVDNHLPLAIAAGQRVSLERPYFSPDGTLTAPHPSRRRRLLRWLRHNLFWANLTARLLSRGRPDSIVVGARQDREDMAAASPWPVQLGLYLPRDERWRGAWTVTARAVDALTTAVAADGTRLAAFIIPDRRQLGGAAWATSLASLPEDLRSWADPEIPRQAMTTLLEKQDVPMLDLLPAYRAASGQLYFPNDGHLSPTGHRVTAEALAPWARSLLPVPDMNNPHHCPVALDDSSDPLQTPQPRPATASES